MYVVNSVTNSTANVKSFLFFFRFFCIFLYIFFQSDLILIFFRTALPASSHGLAYQQPMITFLGELYLMAFKSLSLGSNRIICFPFSSEYTMAYTPASPFFVV